MKNKIGWCDMTFNPVWGCLNNCEYCYAKKVSKRFWKTINDNEYAMRCIIQGATILRPDKEYEKYIDNLKNFKPEFLYSQYHKIFPKKPQHIFVGSMSEIYYWKDEWIERVIEKVKEYPQHTFQFLTKFPQVYYLYDFPKNCWLGTTAVNMLDTIGEAKIKLGYINFISIEPLMDWIYVDYLKNYNWVIIGAETGNRKGKVIPKREWIEDIVNYCRYKDIPVYLKDSLKNIYPVEIKEFPKTEL